MTAAEVSKRVNDSETLVNGFNDLVAARVNAANLDTLDFINRFSEEAELRIARSTVLLTDAAGVLTLSAEYHITRAYFEASPGLVVILGGIVKAISSIVSIVKLIVNSQLFRIIINIHKIAYALWKPYRTAVDKMLVSVSNVAKQVGIGVDGFSHLIHAAEAGVGAVAGLLGKDWNGFNFALYDKYEKASAHISADLYMFANQPAKVLQLVYESGKSMEFNETNEWWRQTADWIEGAIGETTKAVAKVGDITSELTAMQMELPAFIRENIPQSIWDGIAQANMFISDKLLPGLRTVETKVAEINAVLEVHRKKADALVDQLKHPGDVLLGVDDLPDYAKAAQLAMIDDVTSRNFEDAVTADNIALSGHIATLSSIAGAISAPTEPPEFLELEAPERGAVPGIIIEPHETWLVGEY